MALPTVTRCVCFLCSCNSLDASFQALACIVTTTRLYSKAHGPVATVTAKEFIEHGAQPVFSRQLPSFSGYLLAGPTRSTRKRPTLGECCPARASNKSAHLLQSKWHTSILANAAGSSVDQRDSD
jgi:hypothetical protein